MNNHKTHVFLKHLLSEKVFRDKTMWEILIPKR
jgi:hypothetical protein